jgi:hypothetical protein
MQTQFGFSRIQTQFIFDLLKRLVLSTLMTSTNERITISNQMASLPVEVKPLYEILEANSKCQTYICCPTCFALYDVKTFVPLETSFDYSIRMPLPTPPPPPAGKQYEPLPDEPTTTWSVYQRRHLVPQNYLCTSQLTPDSNPCKTVLIEPIGKAANIINLRTITDSRHSSLKRENYTQDYILIQRPCQLSSVTDIFARNGSSPVSNVTRSQYNEFGL